MPENEAVNSLVVWLTSQLQSQLSAEFAIARVWMNPPHFPISQALRIAVDYSLADAAKSTRSWRETVELFVDEAPEFFKNLAILEVDPVVKDRVTGGAPVHIVAHESAKWKMLLAANHKLSHQTVALPPLSSYALPQQIVNP